MVSVLLEGGLESLEFLLAFADLPSESFELGLIEGKVEGDQNGALDSKKLFTGSVGPDGREKVGIEATHGFSADVQQFGMLGWDQGAHEVKRSLFDGLEVIPRVVALVKDQGDVTDSLAQGSAPLGQLLGHAAEGGGIMLVAGIGVVQQRDFPVGSDQQGQAEEAQVVASVFAAASLGKRGPVVEAVDERKKVRGVKEQTPQIETKSRDGSGRNFLFDGNDRLIINPFHIVPKSLAAQLRGLDPDKTREDGSLVPVTDLGLTSRGDTAIEGSDKEVLPNRGALGAAFGDIAVNRRDDIELLSHMEGGHQGAELADDGFLGMRVGESQGQLLRGTDVFLPDDFGFAVDASAFSEIVIRFAADEFFGKASHQLGHTISVKECQEENYVQNHGYL